jgi:hypothetical protein
MSCNDCKKLRSEVDSLKLELKMNETILTSMRYELEKSKSGKVSKSQFEIEWPESGDHFDV